MTNLEVEQENSTTWLNRPLSAIIPKWNIETLLVFLILLFAVVSRFYNLGLRVMSHDEVNHVVPSWELYQGNGYRHDPVTHGPLQFHLIALSYFLLGDNDFTSRIPATVFSIATIAVVLFGYRRYLGRTGALIGGFLFLISPFMLFYGRYARNEAYVALFGVLMLLSVLKYLEKGKHSSLYLLTIVTALNFASKETAYIYSAQLLLFLAVLFISNILKVHWKEDSKRDLFVVLMVIALILFVVALGFGTWNATTMGEKTTPTSNVPEQPLPPQPLTTLEIAGLSSLAGSAIIGIIAIIILISSLGFNAIRKQRTFDLLILSATLILPLLTALPVKIMGWNPIDYSAEGMIKTGIFVIILTLLAAGIGLWWNPRLWLGNLIIFYAIFIVLYTTIFTNGQGFFTGLVGSLGYWLEQQGVERGSQPIYYFALIQMPIYEYLAILGATLALYFGIRYQRFSTFPGISPVSQPDNYNSPDETIDETLTMTEDQPLPILSLLVYWSITSLIAYSVAGEKMPWLTVHIALPFLLTAAWGFGYLVDKVPWHKIKEKNGLLTLLVAFVFITSLSGFLGSLLGNTPPFQGNTLDQLQATSTFLLSSFMLILSIGGLIYLLKEWDGTTLLQYMAVVFLALMALLTIRTSYRASFINYDRATEYMVYAHAARGPKDVLAQVEEISRRTTGGLDVVVAYDNDGLYPYWWYLRNYPNHRWFTDKPTRDLREVPLIIASETNYGKLDSIVKDAFISFEYMRLWWPNQDYFNLTWDRIFHAIIDREMRTAIFDIWLNRDYTLYAKITNNNTLTLENWQPSNRMRLYIRKDIISEMWQYGSAPSMPEVVETDPYISKSIEIQPDKVIGYPGNQPGQLQAPRGLAVAPDGTIYVADSQNHRIQHFDTKGELINVWGAYGDTSQGQVGGGFFNEPWGVAVGPDGSVFVADTWNHRIQKFSSDGQFILTWGYFGQGETPEAFWGPRGIAVDDEGRVYVTDTGNKRVVVFTSNGEYLTKFGTAGVEIGQLDEPVGIAVNDNGNIYVADTWNQRMQVFTPDISGTSYTPLNTWEIYGWFGQSLDNKPFVAVDQSSHVFVTDPEGYRVLEFDNNGQFLRCWGDFSPSTDGFGLPSGVAVDKQGNVWVSDAGNSHLLHFTLPAIE